MRASGVVFRACGSAGLSVLGGRSEGAAGSGAAPATSFLSRLTCTWAAQCRADERVGTIPRRGHRKVALEVRLHAVYVFCYVYGLIS